MGNILQAILNIRDFHMHLNVMPEIGIQGEGVGLELFLKDRFSNHTHELYLNPENAENSRMKAYSEHLSYLGSSNHPPDFILSEGDAVEVKKVTNLGVNTDIQLNSSYPKRTISSSDSMITAACAQVEGGNWRKDVLYSIGQVQGTYLSSLWFVYGDVYAAHEDTYRNPLNLIQETLQNAGLRLTQTREIARLNNLDKLALTSLRVRGMWLLKSPHRLYENIAQLNNHLPPLENIINNSFSCVAIMRNEKYQSFDNYDDFCQECNNTLNIFDVWLPNPDAPNEQVEGKIIIFYT